MEERSSIEIDGDYYYLQARDLNDKPQFFQTENYYKPHNHYRHEIIALDEQNFRNADVILTIPSNQCFNLSNLPPEKDPSKLFYYICKDECNLDLGACCILEE